MSTIIRLRQHLSRLAGWVLSVPIFFKILGLGALVAMLFGGVTLVQTRRIMSGVLYDNLAQNGLSTARSLATSLERTVVTGDVLSVRDNLVRTSRTFPNIRYIVVRDFSGRLLAHTFRRALPPDLQRVSPSSIPAQGKIQVLASREGLILDAAYPILEGYGGMVELGVSDQVITKELTRATRSIVWVLGLCTLIGAALALSLTWILTRPVHQLMEATDQIRRGDFETRAEPFSGDEIGGLAVAFNQMTEALRKYRHEVEEKERSRLLLLERLVQVQEEERKKISRELHDQLGQSLLALLWAVRAECAASPQAEDACLLRANLCRDLEKKVRGLIDEVHRLAWGMRPSILDDYGLDSALRQHMDETSALSGLSIDYQYSSLEGLERLPNWIEVMLYRVAQEAITNVVRHAGASRVSLVVLRRRDEVILLIEDNGRGFDPASLQSEAGGHLGLTGIRERVALCGGTSIIDSTPGKGTTVRVRVPLCQEPQCLFAS